MPLYDYTAPVSVPGGTLTTFRTELSSAASALPANETWRGAFEALADVALPIDNRYLESTFAAFMWAVNHRNTALRAAALNVLANATGIA
jgi:hypothetical protein